MNAVVTGSKNWQAYLELEFRAGEEKTHLVPVKRYGPLSVQRAFYPENDLCHTYLLHPPGGVVGGDRLDLNVHCAQGSASLITMPGANKFYHSAGQVADVHQSMEIDQNASFEFLPQENIYFPGARVNSTTKLSIATGSQVILWEKHCFGRPANHEQFSTGQVITRLDLVHEEDLLFTETQRVDSEEIRRASGFRGNPVMGNLLVTSDRLDKTLVERCREARPESGLSGVTRAHERLLLIRCICQGTRELNAYFVDLWKLIRPRLLQRQPTAPRIWNT